MAEIDYKSLKAHLIEKRFSSAYLLYGEEFLYKSALEDMVHAMLPPDQRAYNYEPMDGGAENIVDAVERLNTFSLLPGTRIVALCDARIFYSRQDEKQIVEKAKAAYEKDDIQKAARHVAGLLGILNLSPEDVSGSNRSKISGVDAQDAKWLDDVLRVLAEQRISIPSGDGAMDMLPHAIEKGFPDGNHLIITTDLVDKRKKLYKVIKAQGTVVDCSVPKGDRKADRAVQETVLRDHMNQVLARNHKTMDRAAFLALYDLTGFDLRSFSGNLEKLIDYAGNRKEIVAEDVAAVLKRTKRDPVYDLTNAISDRNAADALFFLNSLLANDIHPLQALAAIINQIRRLLVVKDFAGSRFGKNWHADCPYPFFQKQVIQDIQAFDDALLSLLSKWDSGADPENPEQSKGPGSGRKKKSGPITDLQVAKQPKNAFPIYQLLKKSEKFDKNELLECFEVLSETDVRLKSTGRDPKILLEEAILRICRPAGAKGSLKNNVTF